MVAVHKALKNSYSKEKAKRLGGYLLDEELSSHNQQVYYHPKKKKVLYTVTGTHNMKDAGTDVALAFGKLKDTDRYKEADRTYKQAKQKYGVDKATVMGHSLGGTIAGYIANPENDEVITLDKGATFGQRVRSEERAYRKSGDYVSLLNKHDPNMRTFTNKKERYTNWFSKAIDDHKVDRIKELNLKV